MSELTKPSNPKEAFGDKKVALGLVPDTAIIEENLAFLEGALKYGQFNWRVAGVKASTYNRAIRRHLKKWWNGQDRDPVTRVRELASIRACCGILIDAEIIGMLNDDRPPRADIEKLLSEAADVAAHLKELFKDHSPPQYTEAGERQAVLSRAIVDQRPEWGGERTADWDATRFRKEVPPGTPPASPKPRRTMTTPQWDYFRRLNRKRREAGKVERGYGEHLDILDARAARRAAD